MTEEEKKKLTEEELIELQESIGEGISDFFENYNWDEDYKKNIENEPNPE